MEQGTYLIPHFIMQKRSPFTMNNRGKRSKRAEDGCTKALRMIHSEEDLKAAQGGQLTISESISLERIMEYKRTFFFFAENIKALLIAPNDMLRKRI